jgi:hypothetical protein
LLVSDPHKNPLKILGWVYHAVHGFRSSFRDWARDTILFFKEVIENSLAHQPKDKAEAAYARSTQLSKRREFMEAWALYCSTPQVSVDLQTAKYTRIADLIRKT